MYLGVCKISPQCIPSILFVDQDKRGLIYCIIKLLTYWYYMYIIIIIASGLILIVVVSADLGELKGDLSVCPVFTDPYMLLKV